MNFIDDASINEWFFYWDEDGDNKMSMCEFLHAYTSHLFKEKKNIGMPILKERNREAIN